jgi:hypothetical protein
MWTTILSLLGIGIRGITQELVEAKVKVSDAKTEQEKIAAQERVDTLSARKEIILQGQKDKAERWIRIIWAVPFIIYTWKLVVWDKILQFGTTDPLSPTLEYIMWTILGAYFLDATIKKIKGN